MYISIYIYISIQIDMNLFIYIYIYIWHSRRESAKRTFLKKTQRAAMADHSIYLSIHIYIYIAISIYTHTHTYKYIFTYMNIFICIYVYIHGTVVERVRGAHSCRKHKGQQWVNPGLIRGEPEGSPVLTPG